MSWMVVLVMAQCTLTNSRTLTKLVLVKAASWCAVRGRKLGWGCCFQSLRQPVKDSPHFPWQSKSMWLCAFAKVFACLSVCLKIMFNFFKNHSRLTICSTLYFLVCMLCMAWRKEKFCHTGWCSMIFILLYWDGLISFLSIRVSWPWHCWYSGQDRICCEKLSCAL